MGLKETQAALAQLYTSAEARGQLRAHPRDFAEEHGLTEPEVDALQNGAGAGIEAFARSLLQKRSKEAGRSIPLTRRALGGNYGDYFKGYAARSRVASREPALDAIAFLRNILAKGDPPLPPQVRNVARYEACRLEVVCEGRRASGGIFRLAASDDERFGHVVLAAWWRWRLRSHVMKIPLFGLPKRLENDR